MDIWSGIWSSKSGQYFNVINTFKLKTLKLLNNLLTICVGTIIPPCKSSQVKAVFTKPL